jgi:O-antigen ligase
METVTLTRRDAAVTALVCSIALAFSSIAASQIFLGLALLLSLLERPRWQWPVGMGWAAAFLALTIVAALASESPKSALPQVRKLYLWTLLPLGATLLTSTWSRAALVWGCLFSGTTSALWSLWEYREKWLAAQASGQDFYLAYVAARITGFMSHWMTFSAHMMIAFALALAVMLLTRRPLWQRLGLAALCALYTAVIMLAWTRSIWPGVAACAFVIVASWRPRYLLALPVLAVGVYFVSPAPTKARIESVFRPHGEVDSNLHRELTRAAGYNMLAAHPLLGLGPEGPGKHFKEYLPEEWKSKPLPDGWYGHLHNVYLQYAAERGVPALLCFLIFVGLNLRVWWRQRTPLQCFCVAAMAGLALSGLFEHNLGDSEVLTLFLALFGIGAAADKEV